MAVTARPLRADAQRNFDSIVQAAGELFADRGTGASLDDIADSARVGNATLYRHFPTRDALIVATMRERLDALAGVAAELKAAPDAGDALREWFFELALHLHSWRGLPTTVMDALRDAASPLKTAASPLQLRTQMLLMRAQEAGDVRDDLDSDEVFALIVSTSWISDRLGDSEESLRRRIDVVFAGVAHS